jgi:ubiquinone/menaquinone biosynthesis C-methylase UbiE
LTLRDDSLDCPACQVQFPLVDGIPDFLVGDPAQSAHPVLHGVKLIDWLAPVYESRFWYPLVLNLYGGWRCTTLERLVTQVSDILGLVDGPVLDAACGPATFGRRVAGQTHQVYGVDISLGMLRQGIAYVEREQLDNVHFARAQVEALPFPDAVFGAAICCGSLHLFEDTAQALREISRTMESGAPLAGMTFVAGDGGILQFSHIREHVREDHGAHIFELPELERYLAEAGFDAFQPQTTGSVIVFSAQRSGEAG